MTQKIRIFAGLLLVAFGLSACAGNFFDPTKALTQIASSADIKFDEIHDYALRSEVAYSTEKEIREKFPNTIRINTPGDGDTLYFLERDDAAKTQTITVRGTANWTDVIYDVTAHVEKETGVEIPLHKGFRELAILLFQDMQPFLKKDYKTYATGHSLGAAVATIMALYMEHEGYDVEKVINFGQPKLTTTDGLEVYENFPLYRVVDKNDIIPMLPRSGLIFSKHGSYAHIGQEIILLDGEEYIHLHEHDSTRLSVGNYWRDRKFATLKDHHVGHYLKRITSKLENAFSITYADWRKSLEPAE